MNRDLAVRRPALLPLTITALMLLPLLLASCSGSDSQSSHPAKMVWYPSLELVRQADDSQRYDETWIIARPPADSASPTEPLEPAGLRGRASDTGEELPFPLEHTDIHADVDGIVQSVLVTQRYSNPFETKIEAIYVFPLPHDSAVSDFVMTIGERRIRGIVREREEAERLYAAAREQGHVASLLTEERPNVFTQKIANIAPGQRIDVELRYFGLVAEVDGWLELTCPLVVGPRYNPTGSTSGIGAVSRRGLGSSGQPTEIPYLSPGERTAHRVSVSVDLDAGAAIEEIESPTHDIDSEEISRGHRRISLHGGETTADRDFTLRWRVSDRSVKTAFLQHVKGDERWFTLLLHPPASLQDARRAPMEFVFVVDCSGSMSGAPLAACKRAARRVLERLDERDTFQVVNFSSSASQLGPTPIPATRANVARGLQYLDSLSSEGGTEMINGIRAALDFPGDPSRQRLVTFMTDGFIGNDDEILREIASRLRTTRLFSFGVGTSVNRHLLEGMARLGRGAVAYVDPGDPASLEAVDAFYERISHPALSHVVVDWGMDVEEVYPPKVPDLFVGRSIALSGRIVGPVTRKIHVHGLAGGEPVELDVDVRPDDDVDRPALAKIWARAKIAHLEDRALTEGEDLTPIIRAVALENGLVSRVTAFVAVDSLSQTTSGMPTPVAQAVPVPAGTSFATTVSGP